MHFIFQRVFNFVNSVITLLALNKIEISYVIYTNVITLMFIHIQLNYVFVTIRPTCSNDLSLVFSSPLRIWVESQMIVFLVILKMNGF